MRFANTDRHCFGYAHRIGFAIGTIVLSLLLVFSIASRPLVTRTIQPASQGDVTATRVETRSPYVNQQRGNQDQGKPGIAANRDPFTGDQQGQSQNHARHQAATQPTEPRPEHSLVQGETIAADGKADRADAPGATPGPELKDHSSATSATSVNSAAGTDQDPARTNPEPQQEEAQQTEPALESDSLKGTTPANHASPPHSKQQKPPVMQQDDISAVPDSTRIAAAANAEQRASLQRADAIFEQQLAKLSPQIISERLVDVGIVHLGNLARIRSYMHKLRQGVATKLAVVGGSITAGLGVDGFGEVSYERIKTAFPSNPVRFHNGAVGGVTSMYMTSCMKWHVPSDVDLVIVEYNVNDGFEPYHCSRLPCQVTYGNLNSPQRRAYERLLRKLLMLPHRPAVIMLQTFDYSKRLFMHSGEDQLGTFAQLYSLPWISLRSLLWERQQRGVAGFSIKEVMLTGGGDMHPNSYGHRMMTDLVTGLLARVGKTLLQRPFGQEDQAIVDAELLEPVLPGNIAWDAEYCLIDEKFKSTVSESPGFKWIDESKPEAFTRKWGFVATKPESHLLLTFSTSSTTKGVDNPHTVLTINHLRSYEHMGRAEVTCVSGCTCHPTVLEGHWQQRNSQMFPHRFSVTQAPKCTLKIRVLKATSSREHKVKIQGLVIADEATTAGEFPVRVPQIVPSDLMGSAKV